MPDIRVCALRPRVHGAGDIWPLFRVCMCGGSIGAPLRVYMVAGQYGCLTLGFALFAYETMVQGYRNYI